MKQITFLFIILLFFSACKQAKPTAEQPTDQTTKPTLVFKIEDLPQPESVVLDKKRNILFVSNQAGAAEGFISKVGVDGTIIEKEWVKGLNNPKGIEIVGDKLYVSDVTELVEIDINKGEIINKYQDEKAEFLNDVAADSEGNIYVSDMFTSAIYKLDKAGNFKIWLADAKLENPNGLFVEGDDLYLAAWGSFSDGKPLNAPKGNFLKVDLATKTIGQLTANPIGNLDGLQKYDNGYLLSDWMNGNIWDISDKGTNLLFTTTKGSGDIAIVGSKVFIPMAIENEVLVYDLN